MTCFYAPVTECSFFIGYSQSKCREKTYKTTILKNHNTLIHVFRAGEFIFGFCFSLTFAFLFHFYWFRKYPILYNVFLSFQNVFLWVIPSVLWYCWLGDWKGIWPVKKSSTSNLQRFLFVKPVGYLARPDWRRHLFNSHFPGQPGSGHKMPPFWIILELRTMDTVVTPGAVAHAKFQSNRHHQNWSYDCMAL